MKLQIPVVAPGLLKTQAQPRMLGHPVFLVQKPRQVVVVAACCSWRAETVPAQRTAVIIVASNVFLIIFLLTIHSPFQSCASCGTLSVVISSQAQPRLGAPYKMR
jgi:hypothetical protein